MGRVKRFNTEKYITYNEENDTAKCLVCAKLLKGKINYNIKRHYETMHGGFANYCNLDIETSSPSSSPASASVTRKTINKKNFTISMDKNEFLSYCVGLVTETNLPFRIFDDGKYFKKLLQPYEKYFETNLNSESIMDEVHKEANGIRQTISKAVAKQMICLKIVYATRHDKSMVVINIQYMMESKIFRHTIGTIQLCKQHTAQFLKEKIIKYLQDFSIEISQIYSCTFDNGADLSKTSKLFQQLQEEMQGQLSEGANSDDEEFLDSKYPSTFGITVVRCSALAIQLIALDVFKTLAPQVDECIAYSTRLRLIIDKENDPSIKIPTLDNNAKWKATFDMLKHLLKLKDYIDNMSEANLPDVDWYFVRRFVEAFKPLVEYTNKFKCEQYIIGDFYRDWLNCEVELEDLQGEGNIYANLLLAAMQLQKQDLLSNKVFIAALYLDQRFNFQGTPFLTKEQKNTALLHLLKTHEMITRLAGPLEKTAPKQPLFISSDRAFSKLEAKMNMLIDLKPTLTPVAIKQRLENLCSTERMLFSINILKYWSHIRNTDPGLVKLINVALAVPTTQLSLKEAFNALAMVSTKFNGKLSKQGINNFLLIKLNLNIVQANDETEEDNTVDIVDEFIITEMLS